MMRHVLLGYLYPLKCAADGHAAMARVPLLFPAKGASINIQSTHSFQKPFIKEWSLNDAGVLSTV